MRVVLFGWFCFFCCVFGFGFVCLLFVLLCFVLQMWVGREEKTQGLMEELTRIRTLHHLVAGRHHKLDLVHPLALLHCLTVHSVTRSCWPQGITNLVVLTGQKFG